MADAELEGFRVEFVAPDGGQHRLPLADAWAVRFEVMAPVRRYRARKGQRHLPGLWITRVADTLADLDGAISRIHRRLGPPRFVESPS